MRTCPTELSTRSDTAELPPRGNGSVGPFVPVLHAEAQADHWRLVEAWSLDGRPFDLDLAWSMGSGVGATARVTVATSTRLSIFARSVRLRAGNLHPANQRIGVSVADGMASTRNVYEVRGSGEASLTHLVTVPAYARSVRLGVGRTNANAGQLALLDADGNTTTLVNLARMPEGGLSLGGAAAVRVQLGQASDRFRLVFHLHL